MNANAFPEWRGKLEYVCLKCGERFAGDQMLYACPDCGGVFLLEDASFGDLKRQSPQYWQRLFDERQATTCQELRGVFRFYELIAPVFEREDIIYLGEANTPLIPAASQLRYLIHADFAYKNDGQNPSASFKDRGMACAFSCIKWLMRVHGWKDVLTICASTGDTSAAAALYASYIGGPVKSVVILPRGKVTPQQLAQPLGSGAIVIELPGVFDDCMKVVERLAENYRVALLNSKNSWRVAGQESYAYEAASWLNWDMAKACLFAPIGNAGNITAILRGLLKLFDLGIIRDLPRVFGAQSGHADPVFRYYDAPPGERVWKPVDVQPSVAQAAMIGNPVSFPRLRLMVDEYEKRGGEFKVIRVKEQEIMDAMLEANRHGHIACTQGGECLAALKAAVDDGVLPKGSFSILDSTAHALKFMDFQARYFDSSFGPEYEVESKAAYINRPRDLMPDIEGRPASQAEFAREAASLIAKTLDLSPKKA